MGNGTKVALVALLILMVVVIARFVRDDSEDSSAAKGAVAAAGNGPTGKVPATAESSSKSKTPPSNAVLPNAALPNAATGAAGTNSATKGLPIRPSPPVSVAGSQNLVTSNPSSVGGGAAPAEKPAPLSPALSPPAVQPAPKSSPASDGFVAGAGTANPASGTGAIQHVTPQPLIHVPSSNGASGAGQNPALPSKAGALEEKGTFQPIGGAKNDTGSIESRLPNLAKGEKVEAPKPGPKSAVSQTTPIVSVDPEYKPTQGIQPGNTSGGKAQLAGFPLTYTIEKGDAYWALAEKYYKNGSLWPHIEKANPGVKLIPGKKLTIPSPPEVRSSPAAHAAPPVADSGTSKGTKAADPHRAAAGTSSSDSTDYLVKKGDTLTQLAKRFYKDSSKFHLIEEANENLKYQSLQEGSHIKIPPERP